MDGVIQKTLTGKNMSILIDNNSEKDFLRAFDELAPKLYRFSLLRTGLKELSEDLTSQSFLKAREYLKSGKKIDSYPSFMYKILRNLIADHWRNKNSHVLPLDESLSESIIDRVNSPEKIKKQAELTEAVTVFNMLPEHERDMLHWRFIDGLSIKDISFLSGKKPNAVYVSIYRSVMRLRKTFYYN